MQTTTILPARPNISGSIAEELRQMIVDGRLAPGQRVNEVHLAASLGVSRTPLREALMSLTTEGSLTSVPRIGFQVVPLSVDEFEQIYEMRAILDPEALRMAGLPSAAQIARLAALNTKVRAARTPVAVLAADDAFHLALIAGCPNTIVVSLIRQFLWRTRRYELALMRDRSNVAASAHHHDVVLSKLRGRDLRGACAALRHNMEIGKAPILDWLRKREEP